MSRVSLSIFIVLVFCLGGCTLAPQYARPKPPVPAQWPHGPAYDPTLAAGVAPKTEDLQWEKFFKDEKLKKIIDLALKGNRDLKISVLNMERARALYGIQRAELFPSVNAVGSGSKQRVPADLSTTGREATVEQYSVSFGISSWELDFFGRIRSLKDRALEEYLAMEQTAQGAKVMLVAAVANAYFALAADRENLKLAQSTLET
ncbi:MAG: TolC family protein, partial [Syntrophales bacterium]|nr:TolC family protein [Syntrophales bacterium]